MEVKVNREIRDYTESMFFGLSMRQFIFSLIAIGVAVVLYLFLKPILGMETCSWLCVLGAAPFAAMGFVKYHGMTAEQFVWAWLRSELIEPAELIFEPENIYFDAFMECNMTGTETVIKEKTDKRKEKADGSKNIEKPSETGQGTVQGATQGAGRDPREEDMA